MGDGKALQMGTSHELGQNFAKAFGIQFQDETAPDEYAWQTSWGVSTRLIGALIMAHGDDNGLRLPPRLAPVQVVVLLVRGEDGAGERRRRRSPRSYGRPGAVELDDRLGTSFGRRAVDWELKGIPVRVEVGPRDLAAGIASWCAATPAPRMRYPSERSAPGSQPAREAQQALEVEARQRRNTCTVAVDTATSAVEAARAGFARVPWDTIREDEVMLAEAGVTVRCLQRADDPCPARPLNEAS